MHSMGLEPWEPAEAQKGKQIAATFAAADEYDKRQGGSATDSSGPKSSA